VGYKRTKDILLRSHGLDNMEDNTISQKVSVPDRETAVLLKMHEE
jgi:hypothetical protein